MDPACRRGATNPGALKGPILHRASEDRIKTPMTEPKSPDESTAGKDALEGYEQPGPGGWEDYPLDELAIRDERRTAVDVVRRLEQGRFVLDPDFQRDFVWDEDKQSRLVESILLRIPLPVFYVAEDYEGRLIVVDGRQRLTTLQRFFAGQLRLKLDQRGELHKKRFAELSARLQNRLEDCQLHFYIIDKDVPERARLDIFERVNGGEVLTRQQMRNALYNGSATVFLREQASTALFLEATGGSLNVKKMQDREFVNRFISFQRMPLDEYKGDMDDWLARGLQRPQPYGIPPLPVVHDRRQQPLAIFQCGYPGSSCPMGSMAGVTRFHSDAPPPLAVLADGSDKPPSRVLAASDTSANVSRCMRITAFRLLTVSRHRRQCPPRYAFREHRAFPSAVRGPVDLSHGRQRFMARASRARRSAVQPFVMGLQ